MLQSQLFCKMSKINWGIRRLANTRYAENREIKNVSTTAAKVTQLMILAVVCATAVKVVGGTLPAAISATGL